MSLLAGFDLNALEVRQLVAELQTLVHGYIDNIYQYAQQDILFQLRKGKKHYVRVIAHAAWLTQLKEEAPQKIGGFCAVLRKNINNLRIDAIEQIGSERIISIALREFVLYLELFGKGNIILTRRGRIVAAQFSIIFADREIKIGRIYHPPQRPSLFTIDTLDLGKEPVSKVLAQAGLGQAYAKELCHEAGIAPSALQADATQLIQKIQAMIQRCDPVVMPNDPPYARLFAFHDEQKATKYPSFSAALDAFLPERIVAERKAQDESPLLRAQQKHERTLQLQQEHIAELEQMEMEARRKAELLYENYQKVSLLLAEMQKYHRSPHWKDIVGQAKPLIKSVDEKKKQVTIVL